MIFWKIADRTLAVDRTLVMGILNVTPDSFSDGGRFVDPEAALLHAKALQAAGADILDIGGQSTRPGAKRISAEEEWARLSPVLDRLVGEIRIPLSVDTFEPTVAAAAISRGAHIINDVSGNLQSGMLAVAATSGAGLVLTHHAPDQSVAAIGEFFTEALAAACAAGMDERQVCLDVGIGFGSGAAADMQVLRDLPKLAPFCGDRPLLVGASRKRVIAAYTGDPPTDKRLAGTLAFHTLAQAGGARILRVHDVAQAVEAARLTDAFLRGDD